MVVNIEHGTKIIPDTDVPWDTIDVLRWRLTGPREEAHGGFISAQALLVAAQDNLSFDHECECCAIDEGMRPRQTVSE